jgi:hypothetical protein
MKKTIHSPAAFVRQSRLRAGQYRISGSKLKFHPLGHTSGSMEAVITFTNRGAIGNYFGGRYRGLFDACLSVGVDWKAVGWVNDK